MRVEGVPYLVPVLSWRRELVLRVLAVVWLAAATWFWLWWLAPERGAWQWGRALATFCLAWVYIGVAYFLFFACRMTRPNPALPMPKLRVAMVVTKAPAEPWRLVRRTLLAMLDQDLPYAYDTWLADELPDEQTRSWCARHGVRLCTRAGVAAYHRPSWPRRTKCKEGNLAYFYDTVGYANYDVVAQLDCDHVPSSRYLRAIVAPFRDPRVGYVAAPSICDANRSVGWTVRGRLYREATMHGPAQAGANGGWAPVCIGSHYAVRTAALHAVGGLGPELAEDYSTTLALLAGGWDGVFAIDAEAHGLGPESVDDMLRQEFQWARSLGAISVTVLPRQIGSVPIRARVRMVFALLCYPLQALVAVIGTCLPAVGVLTGTSWGRAPFADFYLRLWVGSMLVVAAVAWLRRCHALRPADARLWSLDLMLFQFVRWTWTAWGFAHGMFTGRRAASAQIRITPKERIGPRPLSWRGLAPLAVLAVAAAIVAALASPTEQTLGLYFLVIAQAVVYSGVLCAVVLAHLAANRRLAATRKVLDMTEQPSLSILEQFGPEISFPVVRRGWDPERVRTAWAQLEAERDALAAQLAAAKPHDLYAQIGQEVAGLLHCAEDTARSLLATTEAECAARREQAEQESRDLVDGANARVAEAAAEAEAMLERARREGRELIEHTLGETDRLHAASRELRERMCAARDALTESINALPDAPPLRTVPDMPVRPDEHAPMAS